MDEIGYGSAPKSPGLWIKLVDRGGAVYSGHVINDLLKFQAQVESGIVVVKLSCTQEKAFRLDQLAEFIILTVVGRRKKKPCPNPKRPV